MTSISLPNDLELRLTEYRRQRKAETGKLPFRDTAITELLRKALEGVEPPKPLTDRVDDIERRLRELEVDRIQTMRLDHERKS